MSPVSLIKGSELKIKLKKRKVKLEELANHYGLVRTTISRYLNDHMAMPATFIIQVADFTGMNIKEFMSGQEDVKTSASHTEEIHPEPEEPEDVTPDPEGERSIKEYIAPDIPELVIKGVETPDVKAPVKWLEGTAQLERYILGLEERIAELERLIKK